MSLQELKPKIDQVWNAFWSGGISNPLSVIEQITYLLFIKRLDDLQDLQEQQALLTGKPVNNPIYTTEEQQLRWSNFKNLESETMFRLFQKENGIFDFMKNYGGKSASFSKFMKNAAFMIPTPRLLVQVVDMLDKIDMNDTDTKGDVYEYMLSKIATAGTNGQFRTPRHIIKMMVELVQPTPEDIICDPSSGTCGFLVASAEYIKENYAKELLKPQAQTHFQNQMFMGMEFDPTMIRIGAMNLILHGIENPQLKDVDSLSQANADFQEKATLILANPPFKGSLDNDSVDEKVLAMVDSKKTELLFLGLMIKGMKIGGRCAVIIPDGVLFGSSKAHKKIRKEIVENQTLEAVISMPSGVFKPYAGVSTAILIFTKTNAGGTEKVWFYDMKADGLSLDDKRQPVKENDIPEIIARYHQRKLTSEIERSRTEQSFVVSKTEIVENDYDLSINRYKEVVYEEVQYEKPSTLIQDIKALQLDNAKKIRKEIVENQTLEAVISMPSGVFKPYAGVSTAILIFTKTNAGGTEKVWFYDMKADGLSLDDKRQPVKENDIPEIIARYHQRKLTSEIERSRTEQSFVVSKTEIAENDYDLSINRYKEVVYEEVQYEKPSTLIQDIKALQRDNAKKLLDLEKMLG